MSPGHAHGAAGEYQGLGDELAQLAVAYYEHAIARRDRDLLLDLERGGQRLGEHGGLR